MKQSLEDEKHDNPMTEIELAVRMTQFLEHDYRAFLFYKGIGKQCFTLLKQHLQTTELDVEVLTHK